MNDLVQIDVTYLGSLSESQTSKVGNGKKMNYATGIRKAREHAKMSKRKLAASAGFNPSYIGLLESGKRLPSLDALEIIAKSTEVPMGLLMLMCAEDRDLNGISAIEGSVLAGHLRDILDVSKRD